MNSKSIRATISLAAFFFAASWLCPWAHSAQDYCRVLEAEGKVEILKMNAAEWLPLTKENFIKGGDTIRTSVESHVEFSTKPDFSTLLRLNNSSEAKMMGDDFTRLDLRRGTLSILREPDSGVFAADVKESGLFQIFTKNVTISFLQGGCSVSLLNAGILVQVFAENVKIRRPIFPERKTNFKTVTEGFKYFIPNSKGKLPVELVRMPFGDYAPWESWARSCYKRKDARAEDLLIKKK